MTNEFDQLIFTAVLEHLPGYDWRLYKAQLYQESRLNPAAKSPVGALGIAQFMPDTWKEWSPRAGFAGKPPTDPEASIFTGACYMAYLIKEWNSPRPDIDRHCLAMASYNSGLGDILDAQKASGGKLLYREIIAKLPEVEPQHAAEPIHYVKQILSFYNRYVTG